jgi:hypothetical protein
VPIIPDREYYREYYIAYRTLINPLKNMGRFFWGYLPGV